MSEYGNIVRKKDDDNEIGGDESEGEVDIFDDDGDGRICSKNMK